MAITGRGNMALIMNYDTLVLYVCSILRSSNNIKLLRCPAFIKLTPCLISSSPSSSLHFFICDPSVLSIRTRSPPPSTVAPPTYLLSSPLLSAPPRLHGYIIIRSRSLPNQHVEPPALFSPSHPLSSPIPAIFIPDPVRTTPIVLLPFDLRKRSRLQIHFCRCPAQSNHHARHTPYESHQGRQRHPESHRPGL